MVDVAMLMVVALVAAVAEEQGQLINSMVGSSRDDVLSLMHELFWQLFGTKKSTLLASAYLEVF